MRVGWIGTGVMGAAMCAHLVEAGHEVTLTSRTKSKAAALIESGAAWAESPAEVAASSQVVFTMVGYPEEVREVTLGADGVLQTASPGSIVVDLTTSLPSLAVEIAEAASRIGVRALDAPVTGGDVGAQDGSLSVMVGGEADVFEEVRPLLEAMGSTIVYQGRHGAGQHAKIVNQILIAGTMIGLGEAMAYAKHADLDMEKILPVVRHGAAGSWSLEHYAPRILAGDFAPGFYVNHIVKDLGIALAEAADIGLDMPGTTLAEKLYSTLQARGEGENGTQSIVHLYD
ncbi:MAG: NAD(P)-dependent oxidoreductase [Aeromicrobium sp.]|uniref:NAD(P)-dependent oxidoreductase n=1 Tax=Aeromicrobium sp. TaxID=1871063 RepID=UPI0039E2F2D8